VKGKAAIRRAFNCANGGDYDNDNDEGTNATRREERREKRSAPREREGRGKRSSVGERCSQSAGFHLSLSLVLHPSIYST